jgi:hypothetical protein
MNSSHVLFDVDEDRANSTSSQRLADMQSLARLIQHKVGADAKASWHFYRVRRTHTAYPEKNPVLEFTVTGTKSTVCLHLIPSYEIHFPSAHQIAFGTADCAIADVVDAFYLSLLLCEYMHIPSPQHDSVIHTLFTETTDKKGDHN